jgi:hypothetical protein
LLLPPQLLPRLLVAEQACIPQQLLLLVLLLPLSAVLLPRLGVQ